jgi:cytochrome b561
LALINLPDRYGLISKTLHWLVFTLFFYQFLGANIMTRLGKNATAFGMNADFYYNWHKSIGLVLFALAVARLIWRRTTALPQWHPSLSEPERAIVARLETWLYWLMFVLPVTGYLFVMAGGFGIKLFGVVDLPNPIGKQPAWSWLVWTLHVLAAYAALVVIAWHVGLVIKKHRFEDTRFADRMLPFRK